MQYKVIFLLYLLTYTDGSGHMSSPIIWDSGDIPVIRGLSQGKFISYFGNPCEYFKLKPNKTDSNIAENYTRSSLEKCERDFEKFFLSPLQEICRFANDTDSTIKTYSSVAKHHLEKRFANLLIGGFIIIVAVTIVMGSYSLYKSVINSADLHSIGNQVESVENEALALKEFSLRVTKTFKDLTNEIRKIEHKLLAQNILIFEQLAKTPLESYNIGSITARIMSNYIVVKEFVKQWHLGRIHDVFFDILQLHVPTIKENMKIDGSRLIKPKYCTVYPEQKKIEIDLLIFNSSTNFHVLKANPFTLMKVLSEKFVCLYEYKGPKFILYKNDQKCIARVPNKILNKYNDNDEFYTEPAFSTCGNNKDFFQPNRTIDSFQITECFNKTDFPFESIIQIKATAKGYYVYCFGSSIQIGGIESACPNYVQFIDESQSIKINGRILNMDLVQISTIEHFDSEINHIGSVEHFGDLINFWTNYNKQVDDDINILTKDNIKIENAFESTPVWSNTFNIISLISFIAIFILISKYVISKFRGRNRFNFADHVYHYSFENKRHAETGMNEIT